jgi:Mg/Co/Ni transporter MgtE
VDRGLGLDRGIDAAVRAAPRGLDPASASAPFVASLVDVSGLVIYFSVATLFLSGTVL